MRLRVVQRSTNDKSMKINLLNESDMMPGIARVLSRPACRPRDPRRRPRRPRGRRRPGQGARDGRLPQGAAPLPRPRASRRWSRSSPDWRAGVDVPEPGRARPRPLGQRRPRGRIAAAKLLTQARIREHEPLVWAEILAGFPASTPGRSPTTPARPSSAGSSPSPAASTSSRPGRADPTMWVRRAALVATLPWTKPTPPEPAEAAARDRILGWAATTSPTATGSSRRRSAGGCAASRRTTPTASAPSSPAPAGRSGPSPAARPSAASSSTRGSGRCRCRGPRR